MKYFRQIQYKNKNTTTILRKHRITTCHKTQKKEKRNKKTRNTKVPYKNKQTTLNELKKEHRTRLFEFN